MGLFGRKRAKSAVGELIGQRYEPVFSDDNFVADMRQAEKTDREWGEGLYDPNFGKYDSNKK